MVDVTDIVVHMVSVEEEKTSKLTAKVGKHLLSLLPKHFLTQMLLIKILLIIPSQLVYMVSHSRIPLLVSITGTVVVVMMKKKQNALSMTNIV